MRGLRSAALGCLTRRPRQRNDRTRVCTRKQGGVQVYRDTGVGSDRRRFTLASGLEDQPVIARAGVRQAWDGPSSATRKRCLPPGGSGWVTALYTTEGRWRRASSNGIAAPMSGPTTRPKPNSSSLRSGKDRCLVTSRRTGSRARPRLWSGMCALPAQCCCQGTEP
jgi:hypothetical protein